MKADTLLQAIKDEVERRSAALSQENITSVSFIVHVVSSGHKHTATPGTVRAIDFRVDTKTELLR